MMTKLVSELRELAIFHMNSVMREAADKLERYHAALVKIGHPEHGKRPQDKDAFLQGYIPNEVRIAREAISDSAGAPHE